MSPETLSQDDIIIILKIKCLYSKKEKKLASPFKQSILLSGHDQI